jgi:hypothetical protein
VPAIFQGIYDFFSSVAAGTADLRKLKFRCMGHRSQPRRIDSKVHTHLMMTPLQTGAQSNFTASESNSLMHYKYVVQREEKHIEHYALCKSSDAF